MHNKKLVAIIALILTLVVTNVALAVLYMNRDVTISGGVAVSGTISVLKEDGITEINTIQIPEFQGTEHSNTTYFWVKNTGNMPVAVYWNISRGEPDGWTIDIGTQEYIFTELSKVKYRFGINNKIGADGNPAQGKWFPDPAGNQVIALNAGQRAQFSFDLIHLTDVNTPGTFSFVLSFYAKSP